MVDKYSDFLEGYLADAITQPALRTLESLQAAFNDFCDRSPNQESQLCDGQLPLSEFGNWIAQKTGKSRRLSRGEWARSTRSFFRLIGDQFGFGEAGFDALVNLLQDFWQIKCKRVYCAKLVENDFDFHHGPLIALEAWGGFPDGGYLLNRVHLDGTTQVEGFFSSVDELIQFADRKYKVPDCLWTEESTLQ